MGVLRDVLGALGGDHHLLGQMQDGVTIAQYKNIPKELLESIYSMGYSHYQSGNIKQAHDIFLYLCFHDHKDARYYASYGASCFKMGDSQKAVDILQTACQMNPTDPGPLLNLAQSLEAEGRREEARDAFLQVCAITKDNKNYQPFFQVASTMLANVAADLGQKEA